MALRRSGAVGSGTYRFSWHPSLDGIRGAAALTVVLYHARFIPGFVGAGQAALEIFFVLSGFLITSVLRSELAGSGRIDLPHFYVRRLRRLYPVLFAYSVVVAAVAMSLGWAPVGDAAWSALASITYTMNWAELHLAVPTFFGHTWSLSIEEQFYLTWPILLLALAGLTSSRRWRALSILLCASIAVRLALVEWADAVERVRNGTDARAFGFLLGGVLALALDERREVIERLLSSRVAASTAAIALGATFLLVDEYSHTMFATWMVLAAVASAVFIGHCVVADSSQTSSWATLVLSSRPAVALGAVSYSLYLWHPFVLEVVRRSPTPLTPPVQALVGVTGSVLVAAASFHLIERRFRAPARRVGSTVTTAAAGYDLRPVTPHSHAPRRNEQQHG